MQQGERIIVKLDPDFNPTGKPMPDTILEQMKADPDFDKLSDSEQQRVISKVKNLIKDVEDVAKYGTLKEKFAKVASMNNFIYNKEEIPYIKLSDNMESENEEVKPAKVKAGGFAGIIDVMTEINSTGAFGTIGRNVAGSFTADSLLREGSQVNAGQSVLNLMASDTRDEVRTSFASYKVADIIAPISGAVFSLCQMRKNDLVEATWNDNLFIVSSILGDTREEAVKWYKGTTGKIPKFKTKYDRQREAAEEKKNVDAFLSKWDL